jgi:transcriptional regulator with XRE-family HTH domain
MKRPYEKRTEIKDPYMTLQEIADMMGMSRERVRQIEESALKKCRKRLRALGITEEAFFSTLKYTKPIKHDPNAPESAFELIEPERKEDD